MNAADRAARLTESFAGLDGVALLRPLVTEVFARRVALVSSFGTEAAVLLSLVAEVDPAVPVVFLDTLKHFDATEAYRDTLVERLGLTDLRVVRPDPATLAQADPDGTMWREAPDACCHIRKVLPLRAALRGFDAWITGRKRYQGGLRANLPAIEAEEGRIKINPLANWSPERIEEEFVARALPRHPLEAQGYYSIGCLPCTARANALEGSRSGRWAGRPKTECGIHLPHRPATEARASKRREDALLGRDMGKWPERSGAGC